MRPLTVALVDDDGLLNFTFRLMMSQLPMEVSLLNFSNAEEALDYLTVHKEDAKTLTHYIFLDLSMPRMGGWEFYQIFSETASKFIKEIALYIISSSVDKRDRERAVASKSVRDYLTKPVDLSQIQRILNGDCKPQVT